MDSATARSIIRLFVAFALLATIALIGVGVGADELMRWIHG